jgi:hypothetical protein
MLFDLIAATLLFLVLFNLCFVLWAWYITRGTKVSGGDDGSPGGKSDAGDGPSAEDSARAEPPTFLIKPFVQFGTASGAAQAPGALTSLEILWHSQDEPQAKWTVALEFSKKTRGLLFMHRFLTPEVRHVRIPGGGLEAPASKQYRAVVTGLMHDEHFIYRIFKDGVLVFESEAQAAADADRPYRFVAVGDIGEGRPGQKKIAYQIWKNKPEFVAVPGDIAYKRGRVSEYLEKFFPIMNHDQASPETGAPLLRSIPFMSCGGNHDFGRPDLTDVPDFDRFPDLFGYFIFWSQPLNGPQVGAHGNSFQKLIGGNERQKAFLEAAAGRYPLMANFSFDYGNAHWLVLDANPYMDWTDKELQDWVERDLKSTTKTWKFVMYHQPAFTSHSRHRKEQRMRLVHDIFERNGVDIVFMGHAHWYERMYPLSFKMANPAIKSGEVNPIGDVDGEFVLDKDFDGTTNKKPKGIIYLITGGGGAKLQQVDLPPSGWMPFTHKLVFDRHSFSVIDVADRMLTLRQIDEDGVEIDAFTIAK